MTRRQVSHADARAALPRRPPQGRRTATRTGPTVEWSDVVHGVREEPYSRAVGQPFETALPVRGMPAFQGQWSKPGRYWFSGCGAHVQYESRFEMDHLTLLDFDPRVRDVSSQPFRLHFDRPVDPRSHVPDLFVRYADGTGLVIDVKGALAAGTEQNRLVFSLTAEACAALGLTYKVASEIEPTLLVNVRWLAGFRRPQHEAAAARPHLLAAARAGMRIDEAVEAASAASGVHAALVRPILFHLLWYRDIATDLTRLIDNGTALALGDRGGRQGET